MDSTNAHLGISVYECQNPPTNLRVTSQTATSVSLAWNAPADSITVLGYEIFRDGVRVATLSGQVLLYEDTGLMPNTLYRYTVRSSMVSGHSNPATGMTLQESVLVTPSIPTGLHSTNVGTRSVSIAWDASAGNVTGYEVYQDGVRVTTTTPMATSFTATGLSPDTNYNFQVSALGQEGTSSGLSMPLLVRTTAEMPGPGECINPPTNLRVTTQTTTTISLAWDAPLGSATASYEIFRDGVRVANVSSQTLTYTDTGLQPNTMYQYTVRATSASNHSNSATGTTSQAGGGGGVSPMRPLPPANAPAGSTFVEVPRDIWSPNPETSPEAANNRLSKYLSRTDFEQLFPNRYGKGDWFPAVPDHMPAFDYYSYDNLQAAITRLANVVVIIQHRTNRPDSSAWRILVLHKENNPNNRALLVYEYENWNASWNTPYPIVTHVADFGAFLGEPNYNDRLREIAAILANATQETSGGTMGTESRLTHGLWFIDEVGYGAAFPNHIGYAQAEHPIWPAFPNRSYHGRGPMQLSWNFNYGFFSDIFFLDSAVLLQDPQLVADNGILGWMTAIGFWMLPQPPKPSCHEVMTAGWAPSPLDIERGRIYPGFGMTIMIINGGLEENLTITDPRIWTRVSMYQRIAERNGANIVGEKLDTLGMRAFP